MKKTKKTLTCMGYAMLLSAIAATAAVTTNTLAPNAEKNNTLSESRGQNLAMRRQIAAESLRAPFKAAPEAQASRAGAAKTKGISPRKSSALMPIGGKAATEMPETTAVFFESFESCTHESPVMPQGWTSEDNSELPMEDIDQWIGLSKGYAEYNMFAPPADGKMMVCVFYNDDEPKDVLLATPTFTVPAEDYELSFYWYTRPNYLYAVDRFHVDYNKDVFTNREQLFDVEVLIKEEGAADWTMLFHIEELYHDMEYGEIKYLDYDEMQRKVLPLAAYAGKTVQVAFRYWGEGGQTFCLDAVRVDKPIINVSYCPDYGRLFYGYDQDLWWMNASIEFYPVNYPNYWFNTTAESDMRNASFEWSYFNIDPATNEPAWFTSNKKSYLEVTYRPDYSSEQTLMNNFYFLPRLRGMSAEGGMSAEFTSPSTFMQAGGTTEYISTEEDDLGNDVKVYTKYNALPFDIINEGLGVHFEEDEELGFLAEPIFGRSVNTDAWWEHYCFPNGKKDDQFAYVVGYANLFIPPTSGAPVVVNGLSTAAIVRTTGEAHLTANIYTMDDDGVMNETPIATKTIAFSEGIKPADAYSTSGEYQIYNFTFDEPVILSNAGTGLGYMIEITGYHDDNVEFFAPLQSTAPNEFEWALGWYHIKRSGKVDLTDEMSMVCFFYDYFGRELYTTFAIGLDAHYPWLELANADDQPFTVNDDNGTTTFTLHGYYPANAYKVEAPEGVNVSLSGNRYAPTVTVSQAAGATATSALLTFTAPGVELAVDVPVSQSGIQGVNAEAATEGRADVYNAQGICVLRNATAEQLRQLPAGLYLHGNTKTIVK